MMILIAIGVLGTIPKGLVKGLEKFEIGGQAETIWRLEDSCCHSDSIERPSANAGRKNSQGIIKILLLGSCQRTEKTVKYKNNGDANCSCCLLNSP